MFVVERKDPFFEGRSLRVERTALVEWCACFMRTKMTAPRIKRLYRMLLGYAHTRRLNGPSHPGSSTRSFPELSVRLMFFFSPLSGSLEGAIVPYAGRA